MQHFLGVYSQESGILGSFSDVGSRAARPGRAALANSQTGRCLGGSIVVTADWCFRSCRGPRVALHGGNEFHTIRAQFVQALVNACGVEPFNEQAFSPKAAARNHCFAKFPERQRTSEVGYRKPVQQPEMSRLG